MTGIDPNGRKARRRLSTTEKYELYVSVLTGTATQGTVAFGTTSRSG